MFSVCFASSRSVSFDDDTIRVLIRENNRFVCFFTTMDSFAMVLKNVHPRSRAQRNNFNIRSEIERASILTSRRAHRRLERTDERNLTDEQTCGRGSDDGNSGAIERGSTLWRRERSLGVQSGRRRDRRNADVRAMGDDVRGADGRGGENGVGGVDAAGERGRVCVDDARGTNG